MKQEINFSLMVISKDVILSLNWLQRCAVRGSALLEQYLLVRKQIKN